MKISTDLFTKLERGHFMNNDKMQLESCAKLMVKRFRNDPLVTIQTKDIQHPEELLYWSFLGQIEAYNEIDAVTLYKNGKGFLVGYSTERVTEEKLMSALQNAAKYLLKKATPEELTHLSKYAIEANELNDEGWYKRYWQGEVYNLQIITLDDDVKGTGAFRELLTPILKSCEEKGIPVVAQTNNPDNVPLYEHFGFKVIEKRSSETLPLTCYSIAREINNS